MQFQVVFVGDEQLPEAQDYALAKVGEMFYAFIKSTRVVPEVLTAAWGAFMEYLAGNLPVATPLAATA